MSILFMDSAHLADGASRWGGFGPSSVQANSSSPSGRSIYRYGNSGILGTIYAPPAPVGTIHVGFYGKSTITTGSNGHPDAQTFQIRGPTDTVHPSYGWDGVGAIHWRYGGGSGNIIVSSSPGVIEYNVWHYHEIWAEINDSGGRLVHYVDGVLVIDFTGDTRNGGSDTLIGSVRWGRSHGLDASDFIISDDTTIRGPMTIWHLLPNGNGNQSDLLGSDGNSTDNYLLVDEATPDGDTTYVSSSTQGQFDTYALSDLPSGDWSVLAVQAILNVRSDDGGAKYVRPVFRSHDEDAQGASQSVPASYTSRMQLFEFNPVTVEAWTDDEVNALEIGPEVRDS